MSDEHALTPRFAPVADLAVGGVFGPYRVVDTLSAGDRDTTFLAEHSESGARVALRVLALDPARETPVFAALREHVARVGALSARCPAIVSVHDCDRADGGGIFLASEYLEGPTLAEVLRRDGRLHPERAVRLAVRVAEALESAHMLGVAHGSLTPQNVVLVGEDETVKLAQFGVDWVRSAHGGPGGRAGVEARAPYVAPEQSASGEASPQADVYAVGAILYEALAGRPPEPQPGRRRVSVTPLRKIRGDVSRTLEHVVNRALAPDPERRYRDMTDLFNDLWSEISPFSNGNTPPDADAMRRRRPGMGRSRMIAVGIVLGAVVVIAGVSRLLVSEAPAPPAIISAPTREPAAGPEFASPITGPAIPSTPALPPPAPPSVTAPPQEPAPALPPARPPVPAEPPAASAPAPAVPPRPAPPARAPVAATPPAPPARVTDAPAAKADAPPAKPAAPPARPEGEAARPAPEPPRAVARPAPRPAPEPSAPSVLRPDTPAPAREAGEDGGAIIDWLLKESSSSRR